MAFDFSNFSDTTLNEDFVEWLVDEQSIDTQNQFCRLWEYYRNRMYEAGFYTPSPYNQGQAFDFSKIFENAVYIQRPRRFLPTLTTDIDSSCLGYFLEVSYTDGAQWWPYLRPFDILLDECGVWLSSEQLDVDVWFAILKNKLKFRITASVISDDRLSTTFADGPLNSTTEVVDKAIVLPRQFKYRKVSSESIFYNCDDEHLGDPDEVNDTDAIIEYAMHLAENHLQNAETFRISTIIMATGFNIGDKIISNPDSRDIFGIRYDQQSCCWVEKIKMDFLKQQTYLDITKKKL